MDVRGDTVGVRELRGKLSDYLRRAAGGQRVVVMSRGRPIAELHPPERPDARPRRKGGALRGRIRIAKDFDRFPPDLLDAFERE